MNGQPVEELADLSLGGRRAGEPAVFAGDHRHPRGACKPHQVGWMRHQSVDEAFLLRHVGQKSRLHRSEAHPVFGPDGVLACGELHREDLGQEVAGVANLQGDPLGVPAMAGDQAPEMTVSQNRDRHGGHGAHVVHVLDMNGRNAAQDRLAEIEREPRLRTDRREDRDGPVAGIGDDPKPVAAIEFPGLCRNVRGREAKIEIGRQDVVAVLRHDGPVPLRIELIDEDAIEPGDRPDVGRPPWRKVRRASRHCAMRSRNRAWTDTEHPCSRSRLS